jgi:soluble lytic murein transglycosylase-like protein
VILWSLILILTLTQIDISVIGPISNGFRGDGKIAPLFTPEVQRWSAEITTWSREWGLDPNLVATVMQIESCGDPRARSWAGAMGLFQVMPYHFEFLENPFRPNTNATRGLAYLRSALDARSGDVRLALAGYNGGIAGARRPESAWPAETLRYVYWGTGIYNDAKKDKTHSDRLDEWLRRGGASLCAQAARR